MLQWSQQVADAVADGRLAVVPGAFPASIVSALRTRALQRDAEGALRPARVGRGASLAGGSVRGDRIAWLEDATTDEAERAYLATMHALAQALNRDLMLGLHSLEAHYAIYPPGAAYARHRDRFRDDDARVLSCILYLNDAWLETDGGALRVHLDDGAPLEILPVGGTLVLFASDRFEHEVLPAVRTRIAVTGWLRRRAA